MVELKENQVKAINKMIRVSHKKLNLVCDLVRGLPVERALDILKFSKKRVSGEVLKTIISAVANAEHNKKLLIDTLFIKEIWCGKSLTMKRIKPASRGVARRILKPFSNLTVILESGKTSKKEKIEKTKKQ